MPYMTRNKFAALLIALGLAALAAACTKDPIAWQQSNNPNIVVEHVLTHEGIKVFRFNDGSRNIYFTKPSGDIGYTTNESCGKNCSREVRVYTMGEQK